MSGGPRPVVPLATSAIRLPRTLVETLISMPGTAARTVAIVVATSGPTSGHHDVPRMDVHRGDAQRGNVGGVLGEALWGQWQGLMLLGCAGTI